MYFISEKLASGLVSIEEAVPMMEAVFAYHENGDIELLPVVITGGPTLGTSFGAKGGIIRGKGLFGFKLGGYWPGNAAVGLPGHASTTILNDPATGSPMAIIGAKHISAVRTAALDAIAIRQLSRANSQTLALIGCGMQAWQEFLAARLVRPIARVMVWSRDPAKADAFAARIMREHGIEAEATTLESAVRAADIVITCTPSLAPFIERDWVRPGTHVSAMGADTKSKHELRPDLVAAGVLFADVVEQSVTIGDFKVAFSMGLIERDRITPIGRVMHSAVALRFEDDITIFDSSGTAFQDLVIGKMVLDAAIAQGLAVLVES